MGEYVYLFSNFNALKYFGRPNKIGNFKNQLACNLPIDQKTKVALAEFIYTKSWYNIQSPHNIRIIDELGVELHFNYDNIVLRPGFYETPEMLVNEINRLIKKLPLKKHPEITYVKENYAYLHAGST